MAFNFHLAGQFKTLRMRKDPRRSERKNHQLQAWIRLEGGFAVRPCIAVDISDTGAQLRVEAPQSLPDQFSLFLSRKISGGRRCEVKWRRGQCIGVEFL